MTTTLKFLSRQNFERRVLAVRILLCLGSFGLQNIIIACLFCRLLQLQNLWSHFQGIRNFTLELQEGVPLFSWTYHWRRHIYWGGLHVKITFNQSWYIHFRENVNYFLEALWKAYILDIEYLFSADTDPWLINSWTTNMNIVRPTFQELPRFAYIIHTYIYIYTYRTTERRRSKKKNSISYSEELNKCKSVKY
jgi:hypothetical protein